MFRYYNTRIGKEIGKGFNATIHEYREPGKKGCLVKRMPAQDLEKLKQYLEEYCLGFNNKHPFVLNYKGLDIEEVNENGNKYMVYIKMKPMKQNLKAFIRELNQKEGEKQYVPLEKVIWIFYSLSSALSYLEEKDIVHSNIMHDSILFDQNGTTKLGGFAFSKYKSSMTGNKPYQSYFSPERLLESLKWREKKEGDEVLNQLMNELLNEKIDEKEVALKSDVWCLGKLIIDICLLRNGIEREKSIEEINQKVKEDIEKVDKIYQDSNLTRILQRLLAVRRQERPSFKQICEELKVSHPTLGLIEMENRKQEGEEINSSEICVSEIAQEEEKIDVGNSFLLSENVSEIQRISEERKTTKEDIQVIKQNMEKAIQNFKKSSQKKLEEISTMVREVAYHKIYHIEISKENIEGFLNKTETLLKTFATSFNHLDLTYQEIKTCLEKYEFSQDRGLVEKSREDISKSTGFSKLGLNSFRHPQERSHMSADANFNYVDEG